VVVLAASVVCITLAMALVANRHQAMKLANRQQKDRLAVLDAQIAAEHVNHQVKQMIQQQVGGVSTAASTLVFTNPDGTTTTNPNGSATTDANGQSTSLYQIDGQYGSADGQSKALDLYTPQTVANGLFQTTLTADPTNPTNGNTDPSDPLLGVQAAQLLLDMPIPVQVNSTVTDNTVFYVGQSAFTNYALREIPLSIYSLYSTGNSSISPAQLATGDAGRIYVNGSLAVSGQVTASWPLTAQQGVNAPSDGSASLTVGSTAQVLGQTGATLDQQLMTNGNQILTSGMQASGVQVLPTSNFGDPNNSALANLGNQCEFQVSYADPAGSASGQAQVNDSGAALPDVPGNFVDQVTQDSNAMNARWDLSNSNSTPPPGYMAAIDPTTNTRLMNKETDPLNQAPMQFIVLDYSHITALNPTKQTFYIPGNPNDYALLIRGGVDSNGNGQVTNGFSVVTNLDIYVSGGIAPSPTANSPAISLITSGKVHATP
jgi:hypothetical protein